MSMPHQPSHLFEVGAGLGTAILKWSAGIQHKAIFGQMSKHLALLFIAEATIPFPLRRSRLARGQPVIAQFPTGNALNDFQTRPDHFSHLLHALENERKAPGTIKDNRKMLPDEQIMAQL